MTLLAAALILFATFDPSPTPAASHGCSAYLREMVPALCPDPNFPAELVPCAYISPMIGLSCEGVGGEAFTSSSPRPGAVLAFCIYAENSAGRSGCAEPVNRR